MPAPIQALVEQITPSVIHWRRDFHRYPELSNREEQTGMKLVAALKEMGIEELQYPIAQHGVTALIHGQGEGPCIALRADMDALPVEEQTGLPFASCHPGVMHACGHDCHMAVVLGAAFVLQQIKDTFPGTIKILFQPCEEGAPPGEIGGARLCIRDGVLQDPLVQTIFGLHINPLLECGRLSYYPGGYAAAVDQFEITVQGKQTHAAFPWEGRDPVVAAAAIVMAVQTLVSRLVDARDSAVLSIGKISGGSRWNIIPDTVTLTGTIRTHKPAEREAILQDFQHIVHHTDESHHTTATI
ncbi:MAG: amidohydrolase, partial [bacterium]|nr:amidohydrolase [bacterium]